METWQHRWRRLRAHWLHPRWRVQQHFPTASLHQISLAVAASEQQHGGQIRFVIESGWDTAAVLRNEDCRRRAWRWFADLGVWDTADNCGVLVYVSFADHCVEIVADRGIAACVAGHEWQAVCDRMVADFRRERYVPGLQNALDEITAILAAQFPAVGREAENHLDNEVVLR